MLKTSLSILLILFSLNSTIYAQFDINHDIRVGEITRSSTISHASRTLLPLKYTPLPLGSIHATRGSWLDNELHLSVTGLAGHLFDFYTYVRNSSWLGGNSEYSGLNEGFPYAFNGVVALAYSLHDDDTEAIRLKTVVHEAATYVLDHQSEDGWLGPEAGERRLLWGRFPLLLGLTQLVDAESAMWEGRAVPALRNFIELMYVMLKDGGRGYVYQDEGDPIGEGDYAWGRVRSADMILTLQWMLEKYPSEQDSRVWECMGLLYEMSLKWEDWYNSEVYPKNDLYTIPSSFTDVHYPYEHGVNVAQGLKSPAVIQRFTHNSSLAQTSRDAVQWTLKYHSAPSGAILADERLDGLAPYYGSELCTVVETMTSLSYLYQFLGSNDYADIAELTTYNALPAMFTGDHWAHQYMSQPNQPFSRKLSESPFFNVNNMAQTFGLEPHYPCCTVNHPQGLPKFVSNSWLLVGENDLAHVLLGPSSIHLEGLSINCTTLYPFSDVLEYEIDTNRSIVIRIRSPDWVDGIGHTTVLEGDAILMKARDFEARAGLESNVLVEGPARIRHQFKPAIRLMPRANDTVAVYRGALLYALEIQAIEKASPPKRFSDQREYPETYAPAECRDWTMVNASAWNIAIDPSTIVFHQDDELDTRLPTQIFAPGGPPVYMTALGCQIEWPLFIGGVPGAVPSVKSRKCVANPERVTLRPYGSTKLHMAELPTIDLATRRSDEL